MKKGLLFGHRGALLIPWKVNSDHDILKRLETGAHGIISDFPPRLKKVYNGWANREKIKQRRDG